ncbi:S1/P1 nuclease [Antarcticibacterium sp. 1MA-6-2]|uniref:S1/P1 nuclease n=1 Tax=Antarcticibacterium sp. 1MA-6-2 TaxID=2908210 RepID=UPI001F3508F4|nr:S1/P1 nuclease [Antarcticibacterium sp. 1MA-6-2]UJH92406.1 S1/P1 nuclease [Antarcticibacterium sp. 1MA-6-2]
MKKLLTVVLVLITVLPAFSADEDWGQNGHRATGQIAEENLTKKAKQAIQKILQGKSLAIVSTFGDEIKSDSRFKEFGPWHYVNLPAGETKYSEETAAPEGDLLLAIKKCVEILKDKSTSREDEEFYLKMLVHFIGDLHQPLHTGRGEDKGGNDIQVRWFNDGTNLHSVWDSKMIESYDMSYSELAQNREDLTPSKKKEIAAGSFDDWMYESKELSKKVYESAEIGEKLSYRYMYDWFPVVREQLQKGGIRLAKVLNEIYG